MVCISPITACGAAVVAGVTTHVAVHDPSAQRPVLLGGAIGAGVAAGLVTGGVLGVLFSFVNPNAGDPLTGGLSGLLLAGPTLGALGAVIGAASVELLPDDPAPVR